MSKTNTAAAGFFALAAVAFCAPVYAQAAGSSASVSIADTDKDGTIDMAEAKTAAMKHFKAADTDHNGTLDTKEAGMDVSDVDSDKDGTLDEAEYEKAVDAAFKAADANNDGTIDGKELETPAGQKLSAMMGAKN
jgi:Ca2+-binding EF-hand superfamily protein